MTKVHWFLRDLVRTFVKRTGCSCTWIAWERVWVWNVKAEFCFNECLRGWSDKTEFVSF